MSVNLICDGQFGSTGKGLFAGFLAQRNKPEALVTAWAPNAGHTYTDYRDSRKYVHRMLANGVVSPKFKALFIGPGSVIDFEILAAEVESCIGHFEKNDAKIFIHKNAAIALKRHREQEEQMSSMTDIGSTRKGVGAALVEKLSRDVYNRITVGERPELQEYVYSTYSIELASRMHVLSPLEWVEHLRYYNDIQIEGAQGFSLGINSGFYPYVTSRECTPAQIISDCAFPAKLGNVFVWGVLRTFPIRVANRFDEKGNQIGYSGPPYDDQLEITWESIEVQPELTTVTKLERRLFTFSELQTRHFCHAARPDGLFLNFCNYTTREELAGIMKIVSNYHNGKMWFGHGPTENMIYNHPIDGFLRHD